MTKIRYLTALVWGVALEVSLRPWRSLTQLFKVVGMLGNSVKRSFERFGTLKPYASWVPYLLFGVFCAYGLIPSYEYLKQIVCEMEIDEGSYSRLSNLYQKPHLAVLIDTAMQDGVVTTSEYLAILDADSPKSDLARAVEASK
ncbi:hypothetical protein [Vibrio navarrensis]|uniref:hypothetical protein n=1 Tax=Vibrio navarrensis TaxID=29495 RepID=UPI00338FA546